MNNCLSDLADQLNGLLPTCPSGQTCGEIHDVDPNNPCIHLKHLPSGDITITEPCGDTLTSDQYVVDWTSGTILVPCTKAHKVIVTYQYNLAETYIRQAVTEIGYLIRQRNTVRTPMVACCGVVSLPCSVYRILSITEVDCHADDCAHCGGCGCNSCHRSCRCTNPNVFVQGACSMYLRGNELVLRPAPCEDAWLEICYEGGYPLDANECFVGLTDDLADLVLLKAQALAYRNPKLLLDLAGVNLSPVTSGPGNTTDEVTTVVKEKSCGKETTTTTKKGSTSSSGSSSLSNLSSINWTTLATQFETAYKEALQRRTESTILPLRTRGYRARIA